MDAINSNYRVRAVHCDYRADEEEIYGALERATAPLERAWAKLRAARRIGIKFNQDYAQDRLVFYEGQLQQLVSEKVARATLRLLREKTDADLITSEASFFLQPQAATTTFMPLFQEFGVEYVDGNVPPLHTYPVPGGGIMFQQYLLPERVVEVDAFVSIQKMKNHAFTGVTLCLKNLFGLTPTGPHGRVRQYFHHLVRMPYVLVDLGLIFQPTLNIVDGLVSQAGREWWDSPPRVTNTLLAGDHVIATDACATYLMGHDPQSDWPTPPFHRARNALLVAAEAGFGPVNLEEIDFQTEVRSPLGEFFAIKTDPLSVVADWRRTTGEQALYYRDNRRRFVDKYAGEFIMLQDGEVRWHSQNSELDMSRRWLSGDQPGQALWFKYVDPDEAEGEHYKVYEQVLAQIKNLERMGILTDEV